MSSTYLYDGEGNRVQKCNGSSCNGTTGTLYWRGANGEVLDESDRVGNMQEEYVYFNGERISRRDLPSSVMHFYFSNQIGSADMITDALGNVELQTDYYPYGGIAYSSGSDSNHYMFTGKERDSESGLDNFGARFYASTMGRFMTPDWAARPTAVPYAVFGDPQSLNLYAYVRNDPVSRADADGHISSLVADPHGNGQSAMEAWWADQNQDSKTQQTPAQDQNGAATGATGQNQTTHFVSVADYYSRVGGFGHIGVGVDSDDTQGFSTANPKTPWYERFFGAPKARVEDDIAQHTNANGNVAPHFNVHIPITAAQATAMQAAIDKRTADPGRYNLFFRNCAGFVESVLHAGGVSGVPHGEVFVPNVLGTMLWYGNTWR